MSFFLSSCLFTSRVMTQKRCESHFPSEDIEGWKATKTIYLQTLASTGLLKFTDEVETIKAEAEKLNSEGVDIIIVLSHCGIEIDRLVLSRIILFLYLILILCQSSLCSAVDSYASRFITLSLTLTYGLKNNKLNLGQFHM